MEQGNRTLNLLPTIGAACMALGAAQIEHSGRANQRAHVIASAILKLIRGFIPIWDLFKQRYEERESPEAQNYPMLHQSPTQEVNLRHT